MGHHRHALLDHSALKTFITHVSCTPCEETGDMAFDHRTTRAAGTGQMHLVRGSLAVEAGLIQDVQDVLGAGVGLGRLDGLGNAHGQNATLMESLADKWVIDAQIARHRVNLWRGSDADELCGVLDLIEQRQHIAAIARIARRHQVGKNKPTGRL
jgi:hypothetical protein